MQEEKNIIGCYNKTAADYATQYMDELSKKHLDRMLLQAFATENINNGKLIDLGCGPGQTTKYLWDCGLTNSIGIDIAPVMVNVAKQLNPQLQFETASMLQLPYPDSTFGSAIAFYSIVHFNTEQIPAAFNEIRRILKYNGQLLFSFHVGNDVVHLNHLLGHEVDIDFHFFDTAAIIHLLQASGFEVIDAVERQPYPGVEYPSKRAYIWVKTK